MKTNDNFQINIVASHLILVRTGSQGSGGNLRDRERRRGYRAHTNENWDGAIRELVIYKIAITYEKAETLSLSKLNDMFCYLSQNILLRIIKDLDIIRLPSWKRLSKSLITISPNHKTSYN